MAEETKNSPSKMAALWPSLKKKLVEAKKKKKQKKSNPFASQGLEKFALLMAELQAKKSSLVDKTGNSVSAVRYLSRSAQEWTASTIARTASRGRKDSASPKGSSSSEILLLQQLPDYSSLSKSETATTTTEPEIVEFSHSFSFRGFPEALQPGHGFDDPEVPLVVGDLQRETDAVEATNRQPCEEEIQEEVGCSGKKMDMIRTGRLLLLEKGWARSPNSAVALLVALSACVVARVTKIGNSFLDFLTIDLVFRWQRGKLYADFLQSLVTRHIVPHLSVPRGLALLPLVRRKKSVVLPELALDGTPEVEIEQEPLVDLSFSFPVVVPQAIVSAEIRTDDPAPAKIRTASSTRRLVRKISSKLKSKMGSPDSSHSLSPRKGSKFSFSRREKSEVSSDDGWPDDEVFADSASSSKKRGILGKKCSFRKEKIPELPSARRSPLGRNFSIESNTDIITTEPVRNQSVFVDTGRKNFDLWLILGLLVALLFLLVSRLSAIVATSLLFLLLSHAHKESSKYRMPRRSTREPEPSSNEFYRRGH